MEFFVVVSAFFFNSFYKTVHAFREDSWVKSTSHSPGCFVGLLFFVVFRKFNTISYSHLPAQDRKACFPPIETWAIMQSAS